MCCRFRQIISSNVPPIFFIFSHWNFRRPAADPYIEIKRRYNVRNKVYFNLSKDCTITIPDASTVYNTGMLHKFLHKKKPACTCKSDAYGLFIHQTKYRSPCSPHFLYLCDVFCHPSNIYTVQHVTARHETIRAPAVPQYVRISYPSSVTASVTSHWAEGLPSSV